MDKYKKLATNTIIFAIGTFGSKLINFFLIRFYTTFMTTTVFSEKDLVELTANFLIPVFSFSVADAIIRYGLDKGYKKNEVFSSGVVISLSGASLLAVLSPLFNLVPYLDGYGFILYVYVFTSCFRSICSQFVRAMGNVKLFAIDGILATISLFLFNLIFLAVLRWGAMGYLLSIICSDLCSGIFLFLIASLRKYLSFKSVNMNMIKAMLRYSLPLIPAAIMWSITSVSDRIFVKYLVSSEANGIYSAVTKLPNLISIVSTIFFQAWNMSAIEENDSKSKAKFYTNVFSAYQSIMFIATALIIVFTKPLSEILFAKEYQQGYVYVPILCIAVLFLSYSQFLSSIYCATKHTINSFLTSFAAAGTNIFLNILLIPKYEVYGAAIATMISYGVCYLIRIYDTRRYIYFKVTHVLTVINVLILFALTYVLLREPEKYIIYLTTGVILITIINFKSIIVTIKQILKRRKTE